MPTPSLPSVPTRRLLAAGLASALLALGFTACTDSSKDADAGEENGGATVTTKFGDIDVPADPQRVVALGGGDAETALALGVQPIGASDWLGFGEENDGVGPWAEGLYDESPTFLGTTELDPQAIGELKPDLILDVRGPGDQKRYDALTNITDAVVSIPEGGENYATTTEQQVTMIAEALGKVEEGKKLLSDLDDAFAEAAEAHPEFDGKVATVSAYGSDGWSVYNSSDARVAFMEKLGFTQKPEVEEQKSDNFFDPLSNEKLDLLDADVMVSFPIFVDASEITGQKLYNALPAVEDGRAIVIDDVTLGNAFSLGTTLAVEYAIKEITPQLAEAAKK